MTFEEMIELLCEFPGMAVAHMSHDPEVYDGGCKYVLTYKGIVCWSELVTPGFVRNYIRRHIK